MKTMFEIGRFEVPYRVFGDEGSYIVCVNGAQQSMAVWRSFITHFSKEYKVLVFDFPGQGHGIIKEGDSGVSLDEQVEVLRGLVKEVAGDAKVNVFGSSWGGIIAARFAACYPDMVEALILASFGVNTSEELKRIILLGQDLYKNGQGAKIGEMMIQSFGQQIPDGLKSRIVSQFETLPAAHFEAFLEHSKFVYSLRTVADVVDLPRIKARTMIINGDNDALLDAQAIREASRMIPDCEYKIVEDAGHFLHFEQADIIGYYDEFFQRPLYANFEKHADNPAVLPYYKCNVTQPISLCV